MFEVFIKDARWGIYMTEQVAARTARNLSKGNKSSYIVSENDRMVFVDGKLVNIEKIKE